MQRRDDKPQTEAEKRQERRIIVGFNCLLAGILALVIAAAIYVPGIVWGWALIAFLALATLSAVLSATQWVKREIMLLIRLDQPKPREIWLRRTDVAKAWAKVAAIWIIAGAATWQIGNWALVIIDDLLPQYNIFGRRMPPQKEMMWLTYGITLIVVVVGLRSAGARFFVEDNEVTK